MIKMIQAHVSKDETRSHLCGIYFSATHAYATDGFRLIRAKLSEDFELNVLAEGKIERIYSMKTHSFLDGKYPNCDQFFPRFEKPIEAKTEFPIWLADIKKSKKHRPIFITERGLQTNKPEGERWIAINPFFLAPYAGLNVTLSWRDNNSALKITHEKFEAAIMPMRV